MAYLGTDGSTIDISVECRLVVRELRDLVHVVTHAGTEFPLEVFQRKHLAHGCDIEALVLHRTTIRPVTLQTREEAQRLEHQQMIGIAAEVVEANIQTVVNEVAFKTGIETLSSLPLQIGVTDILERKTRNYIEEIVRAKVTTCSVIIEVVVTTDIEASRQTEVVDTTYAGKPRLIAHHP